MTPFGQHLVLPRTGVWSAGLLAGSAVAFGVVTMNPLWLLLAVIPPGVAGGIFLLQRPDWIFWVLVLTAPFTEILSVPVGGANVRFYNLLALAGSAWLAMDLMTPGVSAPWAAIRRKAPAWILLGGWGVSKMMTLVFLTDFPLGMGLGFPLKFTVFALMLFATAWVTFAFLRTRERLCSLLRIWVNLSNVILFYALFQLVISNISSIEMVHHRDVIFFGRPYSVFREPDVLGSFVAAGFMMLLPQVLFPSAALHSKRYVIASLAFHGFFLLILLVRAAWVAALVAGLMFAVALWKTGRLGPFRTLFNRLFLGAVCAALLLPILAPQLVATLMGRFATFSDLEAEGASEYRMRELTAMVTKVYATDLNTLMFGHGDFAWSYWAPELLGENYDRSAIEVFEETGQILIHAGFNMPMTTLFDNGTVGLFFQFLFFGWIIVCWLRSMQPGEATEAFALRLMTFLPMLCILICFLFSYDPITPFFWVLIGVTLAALDILRPEPEAVDV